MRWIGRWVRVDLGGSFCGCIFISIPISRAHDATFIRCFLKHPSPIHAKSTSTSTSSSSLSCREVQQLRPDVRASPHISFAVKAYSALNSNNYVRFFRLVKTASFLNACILHRYFNQIRARALQIILRSHTSGQKKVAVSVGFGCVCSWMNVCVSVGNCMCKLCVCL